MNWQQLRAILWLRSRLSWNQLRKGGPLGFVMAVLGVVSGYMMALGASIGGFLAGWHLLGNASSSTLLITWDTLSFLFLFLWLMGLLAELQRSESLDMGRLLHLPIHLSQVFLFNYAASHLTPSLLMAAPGMVALALGMTVARGPSFLLVIPLAVGFLLMITAWTYCLRGWLAALMVNQRRKRSILVGVTVAIVLLGQGPNLYMNLSRGGSQRHGGPGRAAGDFTQWLHTPGASAAHRYLPLLWLGQGVASLGEENLLPALLGAAGCWTLAGLGLRRAYRSALRFYTGDTGAGRVTAPPAETGETARPASPETEPGRTPGPRKPLLVEWELPWVPPDAGGLALASFRSMWRAPEMKLLLLSPLLMLMVFCAALFGSRTSARALPPEFLTLIPTALIMFLFLGMTQLLLNQFGLDRNAFRSLVLLPTPRDRLLLGKNLAFAPYALVPAALVLASLPLLIPVPLESCLAGLIQLPSLYLIVCILGNVCSIGVPFRVNPGSMKPTKQSAGTMLLLAGIHLGFPLVCIPIFIPPAAELLARHFGFPPLVPVNLLLSIPVLAAAILAYRATLPPLGRWLQRREKEVLIRVTHEVE